MSVKLRELQEQLQEDVISILTGFGIDEAMDSSDYQKLESALCEAIIHNINKVSL